MSENIYDYSNADMRVIANNAESYRTNKINTAKTAEERFIWTEKDIPTLVAELYSQDNIEYMLKRTKAESVQDKIRLDQFSKDSSTDPLILDREKLIAMYKDTLGIIDIKVVSGGID